MSPPSPGQGPWRVFLSHTSELRNYPAAKEGSYVAKAERAVSACDHVVVDMADFPSIDQAPAAVCIERVRGAKGQKGCDVYVGIYGTRWGSPVKDRPEVSYTELEFDTATEAHIHRLVFLLNPKAADVGIPLEELIDLEHGAQQGAFLRKVKDAGLTLQTFANPDQLSQLVERALKELAAGSSPAGPPARNTYTPTDLDAWVEQHHQTLERAFCAIPSVRQRRVHVPLDVRLTPAGAEVPSEPMLLQPEHLEPVLAEGSAHVLLISADGGAGKTSLAFRIVRWFLEGKPDGVRRLPVLIETALPRGKPWRSGCSPGWRGNWMGAPVASIQPWWRPCCARSG